MTARVSPPFSSLACFKLAEEILSQPPAREWIRRVEPAGDLVARFALPLSYCPTLNAFAEMPKWRRRKTKLAVEQMMLIQNGGRPASSPLPGRPQALAIRFSSREPDRDSSWCKFAIDRLTVKGGLGYLRDDRPSALDLHHWWEPVGQGEGFVLVRVYTGEE